MGADFSIFLIISMFFGINHWNKNKQAWITKYFRTEFELAADTYKKETKAKKPPKEAFKKFKKLAENDNEKEAQYNVGLMYLYGTGGQLKDWVEASKWIEKAAKKGSKEAKQCWDKFELWHYRYISNLNQKA